MGIGCVGEEWREGSGRNEGEGFEHYTNWDLKIGIWNGKYGF